VFQNAKIILFMIQLQMLVENVKSVIVYHVLLSTENHSVINARKDLLLISMDNALLIALLDMELQIKSARNVMMEKFLHLSTNA